VAIIRRVRHGRSLQFNFWIATCQLLVSIELLPGNVRHFFFGDHSLLLYELNVACINDIIVDTANRLVIDDFKVYVFKTNLLEGGF